MTAEREEGVFNPDLNRAMITHHEAHPYPRIGCAVCEALWAFDRAGDNLEKALKEWATRRSA